MDNSIETLIVRKKIQKELLNELYNKGFIDFTFESNIIKKIDEDINKLKESQDKDIKKITIKIPI